MTRASRLRRCPRLRSDISPPAAGRFAKEKCRSFCSGSPVSKTDTPTKWDLSGTCLPQMPMSDGDSAEPPKRQDVRFPSDRFECAPVRTQQLEDAAPAGLTS